MKKVEEQYTMLKQIGLAALAATFITGSAAVAHAQIGGGGFNTSAGMQRDWRETHGGDQFTTGPSTNTNAYSYAPEKTLHRLRQNIKTKYNNN